MRFGVIMLSVFIPIILNVALEDINDKIRKESRNAEGSSKLTDLLTKKREIETELTKFAKVELGIELIYQISIQLLLVLMNETRTPTTGGSEVLFEQAEYFGIKGTVLIIILTSWSFKTCILLQLKAIKAEKIILPFKSQLFIVLWSTMAAGRRIMTIIVFFLPSLGLFSILNHWKADRIQFFIRGGLDNTPPWAPGEIIQLNGMTKSVAWSDIDRDRAFVEVSPWDYTGLDYGYTFMVFLGLMVLHYLTIITVKIFTVKNIRKENIFDILVHCLENLNFPFPFKDWDFEKHLRKAITLKMG